MRAVIFILGLGFLSALEARWGIGMGLSSKDTNSLFVLFLIFLVMDGVEIYRKGNKC